VFEELAVANGHTNLRKSPAQSAKHCSPLSHLLSPQVLALDTEKNKSPWKNNKVRRRIGGHKKSKIQNNT